MKKTENRRLVMIGIRRKGEKTFKTRYESEELAQRQDSRAGDKINQVSVKPDFVDFNVSNNA